MSVREKLVELIGSTEYGNGSLVGKNFQKGFIEKIASNLIANGVTVQDSKGVEIDPFNKWISVKDRLPQQDEPVGLICEQVQVILSDGFVTTGWCNRSHKAWYYLPYGDTHFIGDSYENTPVIAWQPLAQPPKGDSDG